MACLIAKVFVVKEFRKLLESLGATVVNKHLTLVFYESNLYFFSQKIKALCLFSNTYKTNKMLS